ncbi:hypothetical protein EYF80_065429 [Liparis tanakae]|uniref:Uncharacterized protein n=1 Tax=Liparis tanakae TaxID=230148 RepID=A0A4Z2E6A1_9TELE|nr:hypothetical protein EYF80_065429 [Liparis tanakae]
MSLCSSCFIFCPQRSAHHPSAVKEEELPEQHPSGPQTFHQSNPSLESAARALLLAKGHAPSTAAVRRNTAGVCSRCFHEVHEASRCLAAEINWRTSSSSEETDPPSRFNVTFRS